MPVPCTSKQLKIGFIFRARSWRTDAFPTLYQGWGMEIILKKFGIRMGMGIEKTIDREWEWEFGTLIRAGIGIGIRKNVETIPLTV